MNLIIFDLEWNEAMLGQMNLQNKIGFALSGEIIEIGAVRMDIEGNIYDQYSTLVRPTLLKAMHYHVQKLTGITMDMLSSERPFPDAWADFMAWCGENPVLLSWGTADRQVIADNFRLHGMDESDMPVWYDAQIIFGRVCLEEYEQYGVSRACELLGIPMGDDAHRAVNDAIYTAQICQQLPLEKSIANYDRNGTVGNLEFRSTVHYRFFDGFQEKSEWRSDAAVFDIRIDGGEPLALTELEKFRKNTFVALGWSDDDKYYLIRWKIYQYNHQRERIFAVARETYEAIPDLILWYREISRKNRDKRLKFLSKTK